MNLGELVLDAACDAAAEAICLTRDGQLHSMGEVHEYVSGRLGSIIDDLMPTAKDEISALMTPATKQAVEAIKPAIYEALRDWTPPMAAIVGGMAAMAVLLGVWISKRTFLSTRRGGRS